MTRLSYCAVAVLCVCVAAVPDVSRTKRQLSFSFGGFPFGGNNNNGGQSSTTTGQPGREQQGGNGQIDVGNVLGSVIGGFLNPGSQNQNDNLAGALAGFEQAINPTQSSGACSGNNGGCEQGCRQQGRFVRCFCNAGFVLNRDRRSCADINECQFGNAGCRQICNNVPGSFACACANGFTLLGDQRSCGPGSSPGTGGGGGAVVVPTPGTGAVVLPTPPTTPQGGLCGVNNGGCQQKCDINKKNGKVNCKCKAGYKRHPSDRTSCIDKDECAKNKGGCSDVCTNTEGSFACSCNAGRVLKPNGKKCRNANQPGREEPTGSCADNNGGCQQICKENRRGEVQCKCNPGFVRKRDKVTCRDRNECNRNKGGCAQQCTNTEGSFECSCTQEGTALQPDGVTCAQTSQPQVESCAVNNGGCSQGCQQTFQGVRCFCSQGYQLQQDGRTCTQQGGGGGNPCDNNNGGCEQNCSPNQFGGSPQCTCNRGYRLNNDRRSCGDVNECQFSNGNCEHLCSNQVGSFVCQCQPGFALVGGNRCQFSAPQTTAAPPTPTAPLNSCGANIRKRINNQVRIVGGRPADPQDWPFIAALLQATSNRQYCGGTVITRKHILTAAHCVAQFSASDIKVRVGEYDFEQTTDNGAVDFNVVDIESHEQYDTTTQENDIAILRMDRETTFGQFIQPACLAQPPNSFAGLSAFVIGWGTTAFGGPVSNVLMEVQVPVWNQDDCNKSYPDKIFPKMMCAGLKSGGKDSCQGDSGGPLLTQLPGSRTWYVIGVVSWGIECARADKPGVYTRVNEYLPWIAQKTST